MPNNTDDHSDDEDFITKSQVKREAEALKQLGKEIYELPKKKRDKLPLSNTLLTAFEEADRISNLNAMRRHFQYVGKILRETDVDAIKSAMEALETSPLSHQRNDARLEDLVEQLLTADSKANEKLIQEHSQLSRQQLHQLIRNASRSEKTIEEIKAADPHKAPPASPARKKLKRYLKENLGEL